MKAEMPLFNVRKCWSTFGQQVLTKTALCYNIARKYSKKYWGNEQMQYLVTKWDQHENCVAGSKSIYHEVSNALSIILLWHLDRYVHCILLQHFTLKIIENWFFVSMNGNYTLYNMYFIFWTAMNTFDVENAQIYRTTSNSLHISSFQTAHSHIISYH